MLPKMLSTLLFLVPCVLAQSSSAASSAASSSASASASGTSAASSAASSTSTSASSSAATSASASSSASSATSSVATATSSTASASESFTTLSTYYEVPLSGTYAFSPFPTPTQSAVYPVFPATDPLDPPPVGSDPMIIPDFNPAWAAARVKAASFISNLTIEQKVNISTGVFWMGGRCVGNIGALNGTGFPGLCLEDSPLGVRYADFATAFPAGINSAATWNRELMRLRGLYMGQEHVGKGVNIALGPMMNMARDAQGGRNWEGFGADPFLTGETAYETILGMQGGGVQATAKHYINNEQEHSRTMESNTVDDRTEHEIYAHPFMRSVMAGVASVMCSYNLINDTYACENNKTLNDLLKREFGFQGFVQSDWSATHSTLSVMSGLDMTMPGDIAFGSGTSWFGANLTAFVSNGSVPMTRLDDMATRILSAWYYLHQDSPTFPPVSFNAFDITDEATNEHIDVQANHSTLVYEMGAASAILLKNINGALPLNKPRSLALIGSDAGPGTYGPNEFADQGGVDGILAMGWGSGTDNFTYLISPFEAIQARARLDHTTMYWSFDDYNYVTAVSQAYQRTAAIVFLQSDSGEGYITVDGNEGDRNNLTAWHNGDDLVLAVAAVNNNTIVVTHSVGPLILEPWIEHPNVTAVVWAGLPGTEAGNSLAAVLYGDWNPSGRLPFTIAKNASDYGTTVIMDPNPNDIISINYTEGLFIDYRRFDQYNITPRFEFGFGLSYTNWTYSNLAINTIPQPDTTQASLEANWAAGYASPIAEGSSTALWLHRPLYSVTFDVENTGCLYGAEIPQLYVNHPASAGEPPSVLKGFTNILAEPGETVKVSLTLSRYDLSIWDVVAQGWIKPAGTIGITVGASSRDGRLWGTIPSS